MLMPAPMLYVPAAGGGFTETGVVVNATRYLNGSTSYATNIQSMLLFASYTTDDNGSRQMLASWEENPTSNSFHADFNSASGTVAPRIQISDSLGNSIDIASPDVTAGIATARHHVLVRVYTNGTGLFGQMAVWDSVNGVWRTASDSDTGFGGNGALAVGTAAGPTLFIEADESTHSFDGTCYRLASWMSTTAEDFDDVTTGTVQGYFQKSGTPGEIEDPVTSQTQYGTPVFDFNGSATDYDNGTHDGNGGSTSVSYTATGAGSFA